MKTQNHPPQLSAGPCRLLGGGRSYRLQGFGCTRQQCFCRTGSARFLGERSAARQPVCRGGLPQAGRQHGLHPADGSDDGDTTGIDLEAAQSAISVSTTAYAWESFGLYPDEDYTARMLVVYEAPDYVKDELKEADAQLEQKPIGRDALVFIVNEENPVKSLTRQQLKDIYAGKITNWKEVGGDDLDIVAFQRSEDSGSQTLFKSCSFRAAS